jgi:CRP-like cAMP-binding protein/thioredoxin reductase
MNEKFKIIIIGAGPGGLSAAARAAELGVSHVILESAPQLANTIHHYQKGKLVMAEPMSLPLRSSISFSAGFRENILATWQREVVHHEVNLRVNATVSSISGEAGDFLLTLTTGETLVAENVVLAIGLQGNIRKLGVLGENLPQVQYQLDDPEDFNGETIVVVGAGDAGVENAIALAKQNRVILINRQEEFSNCKEANFDLLMAAVTGGHIETRVGSRVEQIDPVIDAQFPIEVIAQTPQGQEHIKCHRVIARLGAKPPRQLVESFGVAFPSRDSTAVPQLSEQYETNVRGMYIVGALAGYQLIKQAMNQGYEVVEYIQGNWVEPADEILLKKKLIGFLNAQSVSEGIELIRTIQPLFSSLTTLQIREFMLDSTVLKPAKGEIIFRRNDYSNSFFSILGGNLRILTEDKNHFESTYNLSVGEFFGEMGLLTGRRRSGTAIAGENCVLIETPRRSMLKLLHTAHAVRRRLDEVSLKRVVQNYLDSSLPEIELEHLVREAKLKQYVVGEVLFNEGDKADGLYLIRRGSVTVSRLIAGKEVVLAYVSAGNYVGEMALLSKLPRSATVRAASTTEAILLENERFIGVMERNSSIRRKMDGRYLERVRTDDEFGVNHETSGLIQFLMEQGVGEATDVLLIDYSRCIRCDNCETACAAVHDGNSRLNRESGPTYNQLHVPASCRHCEHPHCMKDCPPDAIHRSVNGEVFIGDSCIGCGNCERNCPYGVIQMTEVSDYVKPGFWQLVMGKKAKIKPHETPAQKALSPGQKAVKCDMCKDIIGGAACVRACPTGAALRVSPEEFLGYIK